MVVLAGASWLMFAVGSLYAWSVIVEPVEQRTGLSRSGASLIFSLALLCFTVTMLLGPRLYGRAGAPALAVIAGLLASAGLALAALSANAWMLAIGYGVLFGVANGVAYGTSIKVAQETFPRRTGLATGCVVASYPLGAAAFAPALAASTEHLGIGRTLLIAAAVLAGSGLLAAWAFAQAGPVSLPDPEPADVAAELKGGFALLWLGFFGGSVAGVMVLSHAAGIAISFGAAAPAGIAVTASALGNGAGRLLGGAFCDRVQPRPMLVAAQSGCALGLVSVLVAPGVGMSMVMLALVGFCYGCLPSIYPVLVARQYGAVRAPEIYGRLFTAWGAAGVAAPLLAGILFDWRQDYNGALVVAAVAAAVSALASLPGARRAG